MKHFHIFYGMGANRINNLYRNNFFVINKICDIICDTITGSRYRDMQKNTHLPIILHLKIRVG